MLRMLTYIDVCWRVLTYAYFLAASAPERRAPHARSQALQGGGSNPGGGEAERLNALKEKEVLESGAAAAAQVLHTQTLQIHGSIKALLRLS